MKDKKEYIREHIIKSTLKVFFRKSFSSVSIEEIAKEADIAKGTLYLYFKDKEDLVLNSTLYVMDTLENEIRSKTKDIEDPFEALKTIALIKFNMFNKHRYFLGLSFIVTNPTLISNREKIFNVLISRRKRLVNYIIEIVEKGKKNKQIREDIESIEITRLYLGILSNNIHRVRFDNSIDSFDIKNSVEAMMKMLKEGIFINKTI